MNKHYYERDNHKKVPQGLVLTPVVFDSYK